MKRKRIIISAFVCALLCAGFSIAAFAGDYDTPVVPIHTVHSYYILESTAPTCTEPGSKTYKCRKCTSSYTEDVQPLGHMFKFNSSTDNGAELKCRICNGTEIHTASELEEMWSIDYANTTPSRTFTNNSGYLDLDGNGIINAKDYAMIISLAGNE